MSFDKAQDELREESYMAVAIANISLKIALSNVIPHPPAADEESRGYHPSVRHMS